MADCHGVRSAEQPFRPAKKVTRDPTGERHAHVKLRPLIQKLRRVFVPHDRLRVGVRHHKLRSLRHGRFSHAVESVVDRPAVLLDFVVAASRRLTHAAKIPF